MGLHLCEKCCKENAEVIKRLLNPLKVEENTKEILKYIRIVLTEHKEKDKMIAKEMSEMKSDWKTQLDKLSEEFATLKDSLNETTLPVTSSTEMKRHWSDLFKNNVDLVENVKCAQKTVVDTSANLKNVKNRP